MSVSVIVAIALVLVPSSALLIVSAAVYGIIFINVGATLEAYGCAEEDALLRFNVGATLGANGSIE